MITVPIAKSRISDVNVTKATRQMALIDAFGCVLAVEVQARIDMPPFAQSAMDGYALGEGPADQGSTFNVIGEVAAGSSRQFQLKKGECVRIFTGAPVPETAKTVVQQEWVERNNDRIVLQREVPEKMHIRPIGEQIQANDVALPKGTLLNPAAIGFLQMLGIVEVEVFAKPNVKVLVTGNELVEPGKNLQYGQIYESNAQMLLAALRKEGIEGHVGRVKDDLDQTIESIESALQENEMVILSGGISVGDHDHVGTALKKLGVQEVFYKVAQKPGKPIFFGSKDGKAIFGLPGNPSASLTCFYEYVIPVIRKFMGRTDIFLPTLRLPLADGTIKQMSRAQFLKANISDGQVHILEGQSSAMLNTYSLANALAYVPANAEAVNAREEIEVHLLP